MSDLLQERLSAASKFLLQSPPGEINDVFTDLRSLVSDAQQLERSILPALKQYNLEQYIVATLPGQSGGGTGGEKVIVTPDSRLSTTRTTSEEEGSVEERHVDYRRGMSFAFDHMNSTASDPQPIPSSSQYDQETLSIFSSIDPLFQKHVENHYNDGVCSIYPLSDDRYPQSEPQPKEPVVSESKGAEEGGGVAGTLAEGLPENEEESAKVAEETAEAAEEAIKEDEVPTTEGEGEGVSEEKEEGVIAMDLGTPAAGNEPEDIQEEGDQEVVAGELETIASVEEPKKEVERPPKTSRLFGLYLVGNKYNPNNYWTGRWRSKYVVDYETGKIDGTAMINIHYYEQGNVQLSTTLHSSSQLSPSPSPEQIIASLKSSEQTFSSSLASTYSELSEETFKGLRRALPKTRSKIDWNKAAGYRLGAELGGAGQ
ncbi:Cap1p [Sporobolomyces salmoneus]|uniref:Cap1p n=1 Tax=Sporobolomyces salmoneus TaxID=183962 RepID=UPI00316BD652